MGPGKRDALVDVDGVLVGHEQRLDPHWATGVTAVLVPDGAPVREEPASRTTTVGHPAAGHAAS